MFKRLLSSALVFGAASLAPPYAIAVPGCAERSKLVEKLAVHYREGLIGGGLQNATELLEVWGSPETGSFTILVTNADGISCVVAAGGNWHGKLPDPQPDPETSG